MRTYEEAPSNNRNNNEDRNAPITAYQRTTKKRHVNSQHHRLMKTSSIAAETSRSTSKVTLSWDKRTKFIYLTPRWKISSYFITVVYQYFKGAKFLWYNRAFRVLRYSALSLFRRSYVLYVKDIEVSYFVACTCTSLSARLIAKRYRFF